MLEPITLKTAPELKRVISAGFPSYKKLRAFLSAFPESGMNINSFWDGGSRDEYAIVELATNRRKNLPTSTHPYFDVERKGIAGESEVITVSDRGNITLKTLPEGFALVSCGIFCGKTATAHVYLNPANMAKMLPAPAPAAPVLMMPAAPAPAPWLAPENRAMLADDAYSRTLSQLIALGVLR